MRRILVKRGFPLITILLFIALSIIYFVYVWIALQDPSVPLIVFKLPRSGSSWLTSTLNSHPDVFVMKEIIQRGDLPYFSREERQRHLEKAIQSPTDKIAVSRQYFPSYRFLHDIYWKFLLKRPRFVGFSINPEYCEGLDWDKVLHGHRRVRIVVLVRTNLIKQAFSAIHGRLLHDSCGVSNLRSSSSCHVPLPLNINLTEFISTVALFLDRQLALIQLVDSRLHRYKESTLIVKYEELQRNSDPAFTSSEWKKRSPNNLAEGIRNYSNLSQLLLLPSCQYLSQQVNDSELQSNSFPIITRDSLYLTELRLCLREAARRLSATNHL